MLPLLTTVFIGRTGLVLSTSSIILYIIYILYLCNIYILLYILFMLYIAPCIWTSHLFSQAGRRLKMCLIKWVVTFWSSLVIHKHCWTCQKIAWNGKKAAYRVLYDTSSSLRPLVMASLSLSWKRTAADKWLICGSSLGATLYRFFPCKQNLLLVRWLHIFFMVGPHLVYLVSNWEKFGSWEIGYEFFMRNTSPWVRVGILYADFSCRILTDSFNGSNIFFLYTVFPGYLHKRYGYETYKVFPGYLQFLFVTKNVIILEIFMEVHEIA